MTHPQNFDPGYTPEKILSKDYSNILTLNRIQEAVITHLSENNRSTYVLTSAEKFQGIINALEKYSVTGVVKPEYSFFLVSALSLSKELLSNEGKRRAITEGLAL